MTFALLKITLSIMINKSFYLLLYGNTCDFNFVKLKEFSPPLNYKNCYLLPTANCGLKEFPFFTWMLQGKKKITSVRMYYSLMRP